MQSNFQLAETRGIREHYLFELSQQEDHISPFFHQGDMDGAYDDFVQWEGMRLPQEHFPLMAVNFDGIRPSWTVRIIARAFTLATVVPLEDKRDDLYGIIHKFFPMTGGEFALSYYALKQILGAQFFGLYGFQSGTAVPFAPDGLSFMNTAHPMSKSNATTWSNTTSVAADLSMAIFQMADAAMRTQKRPNGVQTIPNRLARLLCHSNERVVALQITQQAMEPYTSDNNDNVLKRENVQVCDNPYFEYSGDSGATDNAFNSYMFQGNTHYCRWLSRSDMEIFTRFDNTVFADIISTIVRYGFGLIDPRGLWGGPGN